MSVSGKVEWETPRRACKTWRTKAKFDSSTAPRFDHLSVLDAPVR